MLPDSHIINYDQILTGLIMLPDSPIIENDQILTAVLVPWWNTDSSPISLLMFIALC